MASDMLAGKPRPHDAGRMYTSGKSPSWRATSSYRQLLDCIETRLDAVTATHN
jgi:hypothetical protein